VTCRIDRAVRFPNDDAVWPSFSSRRFPISQESEQNRLVGKCRVYLGQSNQYTIPIGGFHQEAGSQPFAAQFVECNPRFLKSIRPTS
jgi:hypothetical protein